MKLNTKNNVTLKLINTFRISQVHSLMQGATIYCVLTLNTSTLITKLNAVAFVRERTIPTERPPLVGS
jgi:hypothetical protein